MNFLVKKTLYFIESIMIELYKIHFLIFGIENIVFVRAKKSLVMPCVTFIAFPFRWIKIIPSIKSKKKKKA